MKRTPLRPGQPLERTTELRRSPLPSGSGRLTRSTPIKAKGKPRHKVSGKPDEAFRAWIRGRACVVPTCLWYGCEPDHVKTRGAGGRDMGHLVPACQFHHRERHDTGARTFQKKYGISLADIAADLAVRYRSTHPGADQ